MDPVHPSQSRPEGGQAVTVWCGNYRFAAADPFFARVVKAARTYVDEKARGKQVSAVLFRSEMEGLRQMAPDGGQVLLDELEHRWTNPQAPPTLYVITCEVCVHPRLALFAGTEKLGQEAASTKFGKADRSLAPRIVRYDKEGIAGVNITSCSLALRMVIFGHGPCMVFERELKEVARAVGTLLTRVDESGVRRAVTTESYAGVTIVEPLCAFAKKRASAA